MILETIVSGYTTHFAKMTGLNPLASSTLAVSADFGG